MQLGYMVRGATLPSPPPPPRSPRPLLSRSIVHVALAVDDLESAGETKLSHCIVRNLLLIHSTLRTKISLMVSHVILSLIQD